MNQITVEDFDKAVAVPWTPDTCLIAQYIIRSRGALGRFESAGDFADEHGLRDLMRKFDSAHVDGEGSLQEIRASLPITFE